MIALAVGTSGSRNQEAIRDGLAIYLAPPAVVHVAQHNYGRAVASATLRGLLPYLLWTGAGPNENGQTNEATPIIAGAVIAALLDDLPLS